jgi:hypothetical protein
LAIEVGLKIFFYKVGNSGFRECHKVWVTWQNKILCWRATFGKILVELEILYIVLKPGNSSMYWSRLVLIRIKFPLIFFTLKKIAENFRERSYLHLKILRYVYMFKFFRYK